MHEWTCMILWNFSLDFEWVWLRNLVFGRLSYGPLRFCIPSHVWWNLVIFVLNDRLFGALRCGIFCGFNHGLCWDRLRFPFWAILSRSVLRFYEASGSVCRIFSLCRFCPDFGMPSCFDVPIVLLVMILKYWIRSTRIFRYAEIPWFGRPEMARNAEIFWFGRPVEIDVPNQGLRVDWGSDSVDRINSVCRIRPLTQKWVVFPRGFWFLNIAKWCVAFVMFLAMLKWFENGFLRKWEMFWNSFSWFLLCVGTG